MEDRIQELEHELLKTQNRRNSEKEKLKEVTLELGALKSPITRERKSRTRTIARQPSRRLGIC